MPTENNDGPIMPTNEEGIITGGHSSPGESSGGSSSTISELLHNLGASIIGKISGR